MNEVAENKNHDVISESSIVTERGVIMQESATAPEASYEIEENKPETEKKYSVSTRKDHFHFFLVKVCLVYKLYNKKGTKIDIFNSKKSYF